MNYYRIVKLKNCLIICLSLLSILGELKCDDRVHYIAAVYEHKVVGDPIRDSPIEFMLKNVEVYERQLMKAKKKKADIIVFPEYGILGQHKRSRDEMLNYLEIVSDPQTNASWNPCTESKDNITLIQHRLSCMALQYNMIIVSNIGEVQYCNKTDPHCPSDDRYQFNTDIVFNEKGDLIARYRKYHLYFENCFDRLLKPENIYFDTKFGRFGIFTCFDIFFKAPPIKLVETYNITNFVFPTYWLNELPLLTAIGFHEAWAIGLQVNLLSANLRGTDATVTGSGIYSGSLGAVKYVYNSIAKNGTLLVAKLSKYPPNKHSKSLRRETQTKSFQTNNSNLNYQKLINQKFKRQAKKQIDYIFKLLLKSSGYLEVCHRDLCCNLRYIFNDTTARNELFALGAFDGFYTKNSTYPRYFQVCILLKCQTLTQASCGLEVINVTTVFDQFKLSGNFSTKYIYPSVLSSGALLTSTEKWNYKKFTIRSNPSFQENLLVASLLGRNYNKDPEYNNSL